MILNSLWTSQVNEDNPTKEDGFVTYLGKAKGLMEQFKHVTLQQIPRKQNFRVAILARLTSLADNSLLNSVLVQVLTRSSMDYNVEEM